MTPDTECEGCTHNKEYPNDDVTHTCSYSPDTEWEKEVHTFVNEVAIQLKPSNDTMNAVRLIRKDLPDFIRYMRTSRDTYWKERVRDVKFDIEALRGSPRDTDIEYARAITDVHKILDTLLDNLK